VDTVAAGTVDGRDLLAAAGGTDNRVHIWDAATGDLVHDLRGHHQARAIAFATLDGQDRLLVADHDGVHIWPSDRRWGTALAGRPHLVEALTVANIDGLDHVITVRSHHLEAWQPTDTTPAIATDLGGGVSDASLSTIHLDGHDHVVVIVNGRVHLWRPVPGTDAQSTRPLTNFVTRAIAFGHELAWVNHGTVGVSDPLPPPDAS
jgi:WD40 repeat protein